MHVSGAWDMDELKEQRPQTLIEILNKIVFVSGLWPRRAILISAPGLADKGLTYPQRQSSQRSSGDGGTE